MITLHFHRGRLYRLGAFALLLALCVACGDNADQTGAAQISTISPVSQSPDGKPLTLPDGFRAEIYATDLRSPTALAFGPDGRLYVSQLNGGENAGAGQVVVIDQPGARAIPVLEQLRKPTGLAWREDELFITAARDVLRVRRGADGAFAAPETLVRELGFNGRAEGQIELLPDGRLVFEASGSLGDPSSARLFTMVPGDQPVVLATGLKNAYGYAVDSSSGRLYTTESNDDKLGGVVPPEEINLVEPSADYGWPRCSADRVPAPDHGGDTTICATTSPPLVTFPPHTTPTGLLFYDRSDFPGEYSGALYVALWNGEPPSVQRVVIMERDGQLFGTADSFFSGAGRPIDMLSDPRGGLLILDNAEGVIYRVIATEANVVP